MSHPTGTVRLFKMAAGRERPRFRFLLIGAAKSEPRRVAAGRDFSLLELEVVGAEPVKPLVGLVLMNERLGDVLRSHFASKEIAGQVILFRDSSRLRA